MDLDSQAMSRDQLIVALDAICTRLRGPLPEKELAAGWTSERVETYLQMFERIKADIVSGIDIPYMPIGKTLDHSGITSGDLLEDACGISVALNNRNW